MNVVTSRLEYKTKSEKEFRDAEDYDISSIYREIQHKGIIFSNDKLHHLLNSSFVEEIDPVKEYFNMLPKWDGVTDHISELADTVTLRDTDKSGYWEKSLKKFLVAYVGYAIDESITNETSIIFYGDQGIGKTKWLNRLFPTSLDPKKYLYVGNVYDNKDDKVNISTKLLINLDELASLNRQEIGYLKSLYT